MSSTIPTERHFLHHWTGKVAKKHDDLDRWVEEVLEALSAYKVLPTRMTTLPDTYDVCFFFSHEGREASIEIFNANEEVWVFIPTHKSENELWKLVINRETLQIAASLIARFLGVSSVSMAN